MPELQVIEGGRLRTALATPVPLVVRLGLHDEILLEAYEGFGMPIVARTIAQAKADPALGRLARSRYELELLVDCDTSRNQLHPDDRSKGFKAASFNFSGRAFDPRLDSLSDEQEREYVARVLQEQVHAGATIFTTPHHLGGDLSCPARQLDLRLARIAVSRFRIARLDKDGRRRLFAVIAVSPRTLRDGLARTALVTFYSELAVDGFIVKPLEFSEESTLLDVDPLAEFIGELRYVSKRPVLIAGGKNLSLALVAAQLASAALLGIGEGEAYHLSGAVRGGGTRSVYHAEALRSVLPRTTSAVAGRRAERLFAEYPCGCEHHARGIAPSNERERKLHTFRFRVADFNEVAFGNGDATMRRRLARSAEIAADVGFPTPYVSYAKVLEVGARLQRRHARRGRDA